MTTTAPFITMKAEMMLLSSFENHRKILAHLKAVEKYLQVTNPIKKVSLDANR